MDNFNNILKMENNDRSIISRKHDRPSGFEQSQIQSELLPYFESDISAFQTANLTKINRKTVIKYFRKWSDDLIKIQEQDFFKRKIISKERLLISLDYRFLQIRDLLEIVSKEIKNITKSGQIPLKLIKFAVDLNMKMVHIQLQKGAIEMKAPSQTMLDKEIEKYVSNRLSCNANFDAPKIALPANEISENNW